MSDERIAKALSDPSAAMIKAFWENLPSPFQIDMEDEEAARAMLAAILAEATKEPTP